MRCFDGYWIEAVILMTKCRSYEKYSSGKISQLQLVKNAATRWYKASNIHEYALPEMRSNENYVNCVIT